MHCRALCLRAPATSVTVATQDSCRHPDVIREAIAHAFGRGFSVYLCMNEESLQVPLKLVLNLMNVTHVRLLHIEIDVVHLVKLRKELLLLRVYLLSRHETLRQDVYVLSVLRLRLLLSA